MSRTTLSWLLPALAALLLGATGPSRADGKADPRLAGDWQLDVAASDDFDAKLQRMAEELRAKRKNRRDRMGGQRGSGSGNQYGTVPGLVEELPPESRDELRERLGETFRPPKQLHIQTRDGEIGILGDAPPERRFNLLETVTRMDVSGTATISSSWSGNALLVQSRYTNRSRSQQRFSIDPSGTLLNVTLQHTDSIDGKLQLHSIYRRITP